MPNLFQLEAEFKPAGDQPTGYPASKDGINSGLVTPNLIRSNRFR